MPPVIVAVAAAAASWGATAAAVDLGIVLAGTFEATLIGAVAGMAVTFSGPVAIGKTKRGTGA